MVRRPSPLKSENLPRAADPTGRPPSYDRGMGDKAAVTRWRTAGVRRVFGLDSDWTRQLPQGWLRRDALLAALFFAVGVISLECYRSFGMPRDSWPRWALIAAVALGCLPLIWRRRFPIAVMIACSAHMFIFGMTQQLVMANLGMQGVYFFAIFTAVAWAQDRRAVAIAVTAVLVFMFGWLAVQWSMASFMDDSVRNMTNDKGDRTGALFGPAAGVVIYGLIINIGYFFIALGAGASSWHGERARDQARKQAETIERQSDQLTAQAVMGERLRIARELHDVVAHHVSAMGIQAAAARKLIDRDADRAAQALSAVETSSREAVTQMRELLGTLRTESVQPLGKFTTETSGAPSMTDTHEAATASSSSASRAPEPSIDAIEDLVREASTDTFTVTLDDTLGDARCRVPGSVGHSLYRTVQEALSNVRKHSTATSADVYLRTGHSERGDYVEAEILDSGRPRSGTSGSGLGLMGMRERVRAHNGTCEIGPRIMGGYRVRVRIPLENDVTGEN